MSARFLDAHIEVRTGGEPSRPLEFRWQDRPHTIVEILHQWTDWGFAPGAPQRNWRSRRHRNYYRVRTGQNEVFEIYLDRGTKPGRETWILFQQLDPPDDLTEEE